MAHLGHLLVVMIIMTTPKSILFVCLGNICRSPSAQAVMEKLAKNQGLSIHFDSAGTGNHHVGEKPDPRAIDVGNMLDFDLSHLRARQLSMQDFYEFDVIFAMDNSNLTNIKKVMPNDATAQVLLFDDFAKQEVTDPYYGDLGDFRIMFGHIKRVSKQWLTHWQNGHHHG